MNGYVTTLTRPKNGKSTRAKWRQAIVVMQANAEVVEDVDWLFEEEPWQMRGKRPATRSTRRIVAQDASSKREEVDLDDLLSTVARFAAVGTSTRQQGSKDVPSGKHA